MPSHLHDKHIAYLNDRNLSHKARAALRQELSTALFLHTTQVLLQKGPPRYLRNNDGLAPGCLRDPADFGQSLRLDAAARFLETLEEARAEEADT